MRTSPPRPDSAIATDLILLCTSNPTIVVASNPIITAARKGYQELSDPAAAKK
jgi:hypothetical protein